jgi:hypothetical protein
VILPGADPERDAGFGGNVPGASRRNAGAAAGSATAEALEALRLVDANGVHHRQVSSITGR